MKEMIEESSTPKSDRRINRTKEAIRTVFKEMVCELPDDVLREIQVDHSDRYSALIAASYNGKHDSAALVRNFFEYMEAQDEFFQKVTCESRFDYIRERMQNRVAAKTHKQFSNLYGKNEYEQNIVRAFLDTTLYLYRQLVRDGRKIPLERIIEISTTLMDFGMQGFLHKTNEHIFTALLKF